MAYKILNTDGTTLLLLADGQVDKSATSLTLIGRNYASYGEELNNNLVKILANNANSSGIPPRSPLKGQLWYDTTLRRLKVYDNGFKTIGAVEVDDQQPATLQTGDLWFDSITKQLKIYSSGLLYTVGPAIPTNIGLSGLSLPETTITDQDDASKEVILLRSYGNTIGVIYYDDTDQDLPFDIDSNDKTTYLPNATTSTIVSGITVIGDLSVSGKVSNNYLSLAVDLDIVSPNPNNDALAFAGISPPASELQNPAIARILNSMFPVNPTILTSTSTNMSGVLLGTQARVLCKFSSILGVTRTGYQTRVFRTVGNYTTASWEAYYYTTATIGASTHVPINYINTTTG